MPLLYKKNVKKESDASENNRKKTDGRNLKNFDSM